MATILDFQKLLFPNQPKEWDGVWGVKCKVAFEGVIHPTTIVTASDPTGDEGTSVDKVDTRSELAIVTLHPKVQLVARKFVRAAASAGLTMKVTSGTRTYAEQDALFAKGGVTKARGGQSNHNFGIAFDVTLWGPDGPIWESPKYKTLGQIGKSLGLSWGGDWHSFVDEPHFELKPAWAEKLSESEMLAELRQRHTQQKDAFA